MRFGPVVPANPVLAKMPIIRRRWYGQVVALRQSLPELSASSAGNRYPKRQRGMHSIHVSFPRLRFGLLASRLYWIGNLDQPLGA